MSGLIWAEIKQLWDEGAHDYVHDMWNILDFVTNSLYIATFTLRLIAYLQVSQYNKVTSSKDIYNVPVHVFVKIVSRGRIPL